MKRSLFNLESASQFTAALDLDDVTGSGDVDLLALDLLPFTGLLAGSEHPFAAFFDASSVGDFSATYTLSVLDEDLPGALSGTPLTIELFGSVSASGPLGDMDCDGSVDFDDIDEFVLGLQDPLGYERHEAAPRNNASRFTITVPRRKLPRSVRSPSCHGVNRTDLLAIPSDFRRNRSPREEMLPTSIIVSAGSSIRCPTIVANH